jgi:hypothetical protein
MSICSSFSSSSSTQQRIAELSLFLDIPTMANQWEQLRARVNDLKMKFYRGDMYDKNARLAKERQKQRTDLSELVFVFEREFLGLTNHLVYPWLTKTTTSSPIVLLDEGAAQVYKQLICATAILGDLETQSAKLRFEMENDKIQKSETALRLMEVDSWESRVNELQNRIYSASRNRVLQQHNQIHHQMTLLSPPSPPWSIVEMDNAAEYGRAEDEDDDALVAARQHLSAFLDEFPTPQHFYKHHMRSISCRRNWLQRQRYLVGALAEEYELVRNATQYPLERMVGQLKDILAFPREIVARANFVRLRRFFRLVYWNQLGLPVAGGAGEDQGDRCRRQRMAGILQKLLACGGIVSLIKSFLSPA